MTIQSYEIRALDGFGGRIHWIPSVLGAWCPADSVRRLEADMKALRAELDASIAAREEMQLGGNRMGESLRSAREELADLKAELAELKAPPKILKAEEVAQAGYYWWRGEYKEWEPVRVDIDEFGVDVWRIMTEIPAYDGEWGKPYGEFIGPLKATEVTNT